MKTTIMLLAIATGSTTASADNLDMCFDDAYVKGGKKLISQLSESCAYGADISEFTNAKKALTALQALEKKYGHCTTVKASQFDRKTQKAERKKADKIRKIRPYSARRVTNFAKCPEKFREQFAVVYAKRINILDKEKRFLQGSVDRKNWDEALSKLQPISKDLLQLASLAKTFGSAEQKQAVAKQIARAEAMKKEWEDKKLEALRKFKCPKGSKRNRKLSKKLGKVYDNWVKRHTPGKSKRLVLRMDGKVVKETLLNGKRETANTILCYRDLTKKVEPACHYDKLSFSRTKPNGGKWSEWTRGGAGENGPLFCNNAK